MQCFGLSYRWIHLEFRSGSQLYFVPQFQLHQDLHCTGMDMDSVRCKYTNFKCLFILFYFILRTLRTISLPGKSKLLMTMNFLDYRDVNNFNHFNVMRHMIDLWNTECELFMVKLRLFLNMCFWKVILPKN